MLTSKKNTKRYDQTYNFNLSIKLVDKNHIIYNKKATNTQNLFNLMKKKKKIPCKIVGRVERRSEEYSK